VWDGDDARNEREVRRVDERTGRAKSRDGFASEDDDDAGVFFFFARREVGYRRRRLVVVALFFGFGVERRSIARASNASVAVDGIVGVRARGTRRRRAGAGVERGGGRFRERRGRQVEIEKGTQGFPGANV
jgi:hypothetical protein